MAAVAVVVPTVVIAVDSQALVVVAIVVAEVVVETVADVIAAVAEIVAVSEPDDKVLLLPNVRVNVPTVGIAVDSQGLIVVRRDHGEMADIIAAVTVVAEAVAELAANTAAHFVALVLVLANDTKEIHLAALAPLLLTLLH